jgi:hypothetical protein
MRPACPPACAVALTVIFAAHSTCGAEAFSRRFVLVFANVEQAADKGKLIAIMRRASSVGYNGIVLGTTNGQYIDFSSRPPTDSHRKAFDAVRREAERLHLDLIPYAISANDIGYAAPHLSEAIPCRGTVFVVKDLIGVVPEPIVALLSNGDFEAHDGDAPAAWGHDKSGRITFVDTDNPHAGRASIRIQDTGKGDPQHGHGRLWQDVDVIPFRAYQFSIWVKTRDLSDPSSAQFYFEGKDGSQPLVYANREAGFGAALRPTQGWTKYTVFFNSASNHRLSLFLGLWSPRGTGSIWFDDAELREVGLCRTVRRDSLPVTVADQKDGHTFDEGRDYVVGDRKLTIPAGSRIAEGTQLGVSWYQRAEMIGPPFANASHPEYFAIVDKIAGTLDGLFGHPPGFMMTYDEWRVANWDPLAGDISAGDYMARTFRKSVESLRRINPRYDLYVWGDMFDPNENAVEKYFMCNGPVSGSWNGFPKETIVMTWEGGEKALRFMSDLGVRQVIAGYYSSTDNVTRWLDALDRSEAAGVRSVEGFMYTTWDENYSDIEKVAAMIRDRGRWGTGTVPRQK